MLVLTENQLGTVQFGINNDIPLSVETLSSTKYQVRFLEKFDYLQEIISETYRKNRLICIADSLRSTLCYTSHKNIESAENSLVVKIAKKFFRKVSKSLHNTDCKRQLKYQLTASRLAIPIEAFDKNPGFYEFASKNYLYHYMRHYGHELRVDPSTHELEILYEGELVKWDDVKDKVSTPLDTPGNLPKQPWVYGHQGVQNKDMYDWKELVPYKYANPENWGRRWVLECCACNENTAQKNGDHSWFRLKTPKGEIYSIGLYRPEKSGNFDNLNKPFRVKKAHLMQPDLSEVYPCNIHAIQYEITESIFKKIKDQVETDKKTNKELFQAIGENCTQYVNKIAEIAGIQFPTKKRIWRFLSPKPVEKFIDALSPYTPQCMKKSIDVITAVFLNILQVFLGATKSDPTVINGRSQSVKPHINSFWDIFNPDKASIHHPHTLGYDVYHSVKSWRKRELKRLKGELFNLKNTPSKNEAETQKKILEIERGMDSILYDIPPQYKI